MKPYAQVDGSVTNRLSQLLKAKIDRGETRANTGKGFCDYTKNRSSCAASCPQRAGSAILCVRLAGSAIAPWSWLPAPLKSFFMPMVTQFIRHTVRAADPIGNKPRQ